MSIRGGLERHTNLFPGCRFGDLADNLIQDNVLACNIWEVASNLSAMFCVLGSIPGCQA